jgi:hypothetical protein
MKPQNSIYIKIFQNLTCPRNPKNGNAQGITRKKAGAFTKKQPALCISTSLSWKWNQAGSRNLPT